MLITLMNEQKMSGWIMWMKNIQYTFKNEVRSISERTQNENVLFA